MRSFLAITAVCAGRLVYYMIKLFRLGCGSAFPGWVARAIFPDIFGYLSGRIQGDVVYITGTNGKTTTTHFLTTLMGKKDLVVNTLGANLETGLISSLITKLWARHAIFEVDEKFLPYFLHKKIPRVLVCLNLFRDQIERYGEIESTKNAWKAAMEKLPLSTKLLFNGDDPLLVFLSSELARPVHFFGLNEEGRGALTHAVDSIHCPFCKIGLKYKSVFLAHLGDYYCRRCDFKRGVSMIDSRGWQEHFPQMHNKYNALAAVCAALLLGRGSEGLKKNIQKCSLPFGRGERVKVAGTEILLLLSKNPVSFNVSIATIKELRAKGELGGVMLALNDRDADSKDISWIWDGEMGELISLSEKFYLTGTRAHELGLCMSHFGMGILVIDPHLASLLKQAIKDTPHGKTLCILSTYTAFLEIASGCQRLTI